MKNNFEKLCFKIYRSIDPVFLEILIPLIDFSRKLNSKPPIPKKEKLAKIDYPQFSDKVIMLHGVSVGEVMSLENLIKKIKSDFKDYQLVVTTGTFTGQELAKKKYGELADFITYFPLDAYKTVEKFLKAVSPSVILIAETELWPNFSYCAKKMNIPLYIINGRISDKSYPEYLKIKGFLGLVLDCFEGIFVQSEIDKNRFIALGANPNTCEISKNLKFEIEKKDCNIDLKTNEKIFIAGSTHKGEDEIVIEVYKKLKEEDKNLKMIIAPRHLTRVDEVVKLIEKHNFKYGLRTKNDTFANNDIIVLDTLGELSKIYSIVNLAFIGGSFNKTGGHNPLEALIYKKPVISGPSIKNFRDIYSILEREKSAFVVKNKDEFYKIARKLLQDDEFYKETAQNCESCFNSQQGALDFITEKLKGVLCKK